MLLQCSTQTFTLKCFNAPIKCLTQPSIVSRIFCEILKNDTKFFFYQIILLSIKIFLEYDRFFICNASVEIPLLETS